MNDKNVYLWAGKGTMIMTVVPCQKSEHIETRQTQTLAFRMFKVSTKSLSVLWLFMHVHWLGANVLKYA